MTQEEVLNALRQVMDPELGINIVDLGLVYTVELEERRVHVGMTMTSAACPLNEVLRSEAETAIRREIPDVSSVDVRVVWDPPWHPSMMSPEARRQLGWSG